MFTYLYKNDRMTPTPRWRRRKSTKPSWRHEKGALSLGRKDWQLAVIMLGWRRFIYSRYGMCFHGDNNRREAKYHYKSSRIISLQQVHTHPHIHRNHIPRECISFEKCHNLCEYKRTNDALLSMMLLLKLSMITGWVYSLFVTYCPKSLQSLADVKYFCQRQISSFMILHINLYHIIFSLWLLYIVCVFRWFAML